MSLFVQYGCGMSAPVGWRNFDASPTLRIGRMPVFGRLFAQNLPRFPPNVEYGDIVKGLPIRAESCDAVYCSHILEHLSLAELRIALGVTRKILKQSGVFRLVVPDLEVLVSTYLESKCNGAAFEFMRATGLGVEERPRGIVGQAKALFGNSRHLWMWDYRSLSGELIQAGFSKVRRATIGDSDEQAFLLVEEENRWKDCLGIEAIK